MYIFVCVMCAHAHARSHGKYDENHMISFREMEQCELQIRQLVSSATTHQHISELLQEANPEANGLSERSVRRFYQEKGISYRSHLDDQEVDQVVQGAIQEVGNGYGRRMMHGLLSSRNLHVSQSRVAASLQ